MARAIPTSQLRRPAADFRKAGARLIAVSVVFIILGISAIAEPAIAGVAPAILIGWLLTLGGVGHLSLELSGKGTSRVISLMILGIMYIISGAYCLKYPVFDLGRLTQLLSLIFLAEGTLEFIAYLGTRNESGSGWLLVNGLITLLIGGLISIRWNSSSVWAIGTLLGLNLMMTGFSRLMQGITARKPATRVAGSEA